MEKKVTFLTPIEVKEPPAHTQIIPRCFTCNKFQTCLLRGSYLKTALLIQNILGDLQSDYCLCKSTPDQNYPWYQGMPIENPETIFPAEITFTKRILPSGEVLTDHVIGQLDSAKYQDFNTILFVYKSGGYVIVFKALYDETKEEFTIYDGKEIVYYITYEFPQDSVLEVQVNLDTWRNEMIEREKTKVEMIDTTHFSAQLNCQFYEPVRGLSPEEGAKRIFMQFPDGIPCDEEGTYYHIETIHLEPRKIPWYNPATRAIGFVPMPYLQYIPVQCKKEKTYRRDDLNDE